MQMAIHNRIFILLNDFCTRNFQISQNLILCDPFLDYDTRVLQHVV